MTGPDAHAPAQHLAVDAITAAADRIAGHIHHTPVLTSATIDHLAGARVHLKAEHLQRSGSFKARGAHNALLALDAAERARGVVAVSSGNHAAAVACAGDRLGIGVDVYMPTDAPALKLAAARGCGATVHTFDRATESRDTVAADHVAAHNSVVTAPFEDPRVMAGQGTVALELVAQVEPDLDSIVVPMSGGGLMAGCAVATASRAPGCRIVGVEPTGADDTRRSFAAGERVAVTADTIADGLAVTTPGPTTFAINRRLVDEVVTVTDAELVDAMRVLFERTKQVVEPSGAAALAAVLGGRVVGDDIGVVISGGNIGIDRFAALTATTHRGPADG